VRTDAAVDGVDQRAAEAPAGYGRRLLGVDGARIREEQPIVKGIVVVQLLAIVFLGILTVTTFQIWAPVDEHAHFDYVQDISDRHVMPTLDPHIALGRSFGVHTYEAFQPPLYYVVAAPLLKISHVHHTRILILRSFGLFLLLASVVVFWRLTALAFPSRPLLPFAFGLSIFLLPGVIVRSVTVSYQPLATFLALLCLLLLFKADTAAKGEANRWLLGASVVLGLAVLSHVLLAYLAAVFAIVAVRRIWRERDRRIFVTLAVCVAITVVLVAPWVAFNISHYGSTTANLLARKIQQPLINPKNRDYTIGYVPHIVSEYIRDFFLPNEWTPLTKLMHSVSATDWTMAVVLFAVPTAVLLVRPRPFGRDRTFLLAVAFLLNFVLVVGTSVAADWPSFGRYLYGSAAPWMLFVYAVTRPLVPFRAVVLAVPVLATAGAAYLWIEGAAKFL
jgi:4-amino-4-deoxy-L-arabinose transferase-like glycosyltransferase